MRHSGTGHETLWSFLQRQARPVPPQCQWGRAVPGQGLSPGERRLWNDTVTPAERAATEPSGMSCLSKALSAPPGAPHGGHHAAGPPVGCPRGPWVFWAWGRTQSGPHPEQRHRVPACSWPSRCIPWPVGQALTGGSCPADSQQLVWGEQQFSDHLLAVGGARSTPPQCHPSLPGGHSCPQYPHRRGTCPLPQGCGGSHWGCHLQGPTSSHCVSVMVGAALAPPMPVHKLRRSRFGPCGQSSPPCATSRVGRAGRGGREVGCQLAAAAGGGWRFLDSCSSQAGT